MKLKFDPALDYQQQAVDAVLGVLDGQPPAQPSGIELAGGGMLPSEFGIGNNIALTDDQLLENVRKVQEANNIEKISTLQGREFSVEMETGTGKTYVYLRTIFELARRYGLRKFTIVVPSVAVREGVMKSIEMTKEHFRNLYDKAPFSCFIYDSKKLSQVRQFAASNQIEIMVINIQSFAKDVPDKETEMMSEREQKKLNIINRENDRMQGHRPIEFIQATRPVVVIDEPQSVDNTDNAKRAIANLSPSITLRYSATHRNPYNLLYRLDPIRAYDLRLVKRIEVASVRTEDGFNDGYVKLLKTDNKKGIKARVEIHSQSGGTVAPAKIWVKQHDDLHTKSGGREVYRNNYIVRAIDCTPGGEYIEFSGGMQLEIGGEEGGLGDDVMKAQIWDTVEQHLSKERVLRGQGIKVLSLFFIDRVANYRVYGESGAAQKGKIARWFEEAYIELTKKPLFKDFAPEKLGCEIDKMHDGYFSQDKRSGRLKDSTERGSREDEDAYSLIMRDKERLLDAAQPLRFIFSHSALREGWDNPNVFQICTLNESQSAEKKRQIIGRGLRLAVNQDGERVHDENINRLTVVANESYEDFARQLQSEFEQEYGIRFGHIEKTAFAGILRTINGEEKPIGQKASTAIWDALLAGGYIDKSGAIQDKFDPSHKHFELNIDSAYDDIKPAIIDVIKRHVFRSRVKNARQRKAVKLQKEVLLGDEFKQLWEKIKHRTRYRVAYKTARLIKDAVRRINDMPAIQPARIAITRREVDITPGGVDMTRELGVSGYDEAQAPNTLPDLLAELQKATELTRRTLAKILIQSNRLDEFKINPQRFMEAAAKEISAALQSLIIDGIQYEKIAGCAWEMRRIEEDAEREISRYLDNLYKVQSKGKCIFDGVECDSEVERRFAEALDSNESIRVFTKLPRWFAVETPIGPYNPDWAFVAEQDRKLYLVCETKSSIDKDQLRLAESQKIKCGEKHFQTIGVDYHPCTKLSEALASIPKPPARKSTSKRKGLARP